MAYPGTFMIYAALSCVLIGCADEMLKPTWPQSETIAATSLAPDKTAEAVLTTGKERGQYLFEIREFESDNTLARRKISAPLSYHEHIISLHWTETHQAEVTIDYDFGDNNLKFVLSY